MHRPERMRMWQELEVMRKVRSRHTTDFCSLCIFLL